MAVDGPRQRLVEVECRTDDVSPSANRFCGGFHIASTPLRTSGAARRDTSADCGRHWVVQSSTQRNRVGAPTGWRLVPGKTTRPHLREGAPLLRRAGFLQHQLWATPFSSERRQMYPGGDFPNQNPREGDGLVRWSAEDASLDDASIVLWYVFGCTHVPRAEDWPVMPVEHAGFVLQPCGFFDRSCAIEDVPRGNRAGRGGSKARL